MGLLDLLDLDHLREGLNPGDEAYMICPVRKATDPEKKFLEAYKAKMSEFGIKAHYPAKDTNQEADLGGYRICKDHYEEQKRAKQFNVFWNGTSTGSYVDLGTCLYMNWKEGKKIKLLNREDVENMVSTSEESEDKTYERALLTLDSGKNFELTDNNYGLVEDENIEIEWASSGMKRYVDLGVLLYAHFEEGKNIRLKNRSFVEEVVKGQEEDGIMKSYEHVLLYMDDLARSA